MTEARDCAVPLQRADAGVVPGTFVEPTPAQAQAWQAIADGKDTLVIAPTGSGKTLAAFLWAIDRLARRRRAGRAPGCSTSPR